MREQLRMNVVPMIRDPIVEATARLRDLAAEGYSGASFGLGETELLQLLDPRNVEELEERVKQSPDKLQRLSEFLPPAPKHFELIPFDKIAIDTTPAYLVKGIVPRIGLCVFWGPPKCGKSFLVFDLMMHVALG